MRSKSDNRQSCRAAGGWPADEEAAADRDQEDDARLAASFSREWSHPEVAAVPAHRAEEDLAASGSQPASAGRAAEAPPPSPLGASAFVANVEAPFGVPAKSRMGEPLSWGSGAGPPAGWCVSSPASSTDYKDGYGCAH